MERRTEGYSNKPVPEQLFLVAQIGVCLAKEQGMLRVSPGAENAHVFLAKELNYLDINPENDIQEATHRFIGRIGRTGYRRWSMRLAEPYWLNAANGEDGYRAMYSFEWTDREVTRSERWLKAKTPDDLAAEEDGQSVHRSFLNAIYQYGQISMADTDQIIDRMNQFSSQSRAVRFINSAW